MRKLTGGLLAVLLGEFLVLSHKDKKFKAAVKKKKGRDKVEYIFQSLFQFNKTLVEEVQGEVKKVDVDKKLQAWKTKAKKEYTAIVKKIGEVEEQIDNYTDKDIEKIVAELTTKWTILIDKVTTIANEIDEKYDLEEKVVAIKQHIDTLQKDAKKNAKKK